MNRGVVLCVLVAVLVTGSLAWLGCEDKQRGDYHEIETALSKFYENTKGKTNWPASYKARWENEKKCAWDGNERATPAPAGTRCLNGGWHKLPPEADGGLLFLEHVSGTAEGEIPAEFKSFQMTDFINLHGNKLHGSIWDTQYHCFMHRLDLSNNAMSGTLPNKEFMKGAKAHSELINLGHNQFEGSIPESINGLEALTSLLLNDNKFEGEVPDMSHCQEMRHLNLANNKLKGNFGGSGWVKELKNLAWLELDNNSFEGTLPELPPKVSRFTAPNNKFSGKVPESYGKMGYLRHFDCSGCDLTCPSDDMLSHLPFSTHCNKKKKSWEKSE